jgi:tetratricopeptide (TPR) repeat protein
MIKNDDIKKDDKTEVLFLTKSGNAAFNRKDYKMAIMNCTAAIRLDEKETEAYYIRGNAHYEKGEWDKAIADYAKGWLHHEDETNIKRSRATRNRAGSSPCFADIDYYDGIIQDYTESLQIERNDIAVYNMRGEAYIRRAACSPFLCDIFYYTLAYNDFVDMLRLLPYNINIEAYRRCGDISVLQRDYAYAIGNYTKVIEIAPNHADAYKKRGNAYRRRGSANNTKDDYYKAIADYNEAIRLAPNDPEAYMERAYIYRLTNNYDRAFADYSEAIRLDPNCAAAYSQRAGIYSRKGDYDKAIADYTDAIRLEPKYANPFRHRGYAYMKKGDYTQARADINRALQIDPNYKSAKDIDAELLKKGY